MKRLLTVIFLFLILMPNPAIAENKNVVVFAVEQSKPVAVSLIESADYVSFAVTIISRQKELEDEFREISEARQLLIKEAQKNKKVKIHNGPIYLSSTSNSKSSFSYGSSQVTTHLLISLSDTDGDVFKAVSEITELVEKIKAPGKVSYSLSPMKLAVDNPDKFRAKLLNMICEDINQMRDLVKTQVNFFVTGIENPVMVRQFDYTQVEIFLNYTLSMEVGSE